MLTGLDNLTTKNGQSGNRFNGKVDLTRVAAMGYSQGGGGAMAAARDPRVDTTVAIQPWRGSTTGIRVSTLYLAGSAYHGIGISDSIRYGEVVAKKIIHQFEKG